MWLSSSDVNTSTATRTTATAATKNDDDDGSTSGWAPLVVRGNGVTQLHHVLGVSVSVPPDF